MTTGAEHAPSHTPCKAREGTCPGHVRDISETCPIGTLVHHLQGVCTLWRAPPPQPASSHSRRRGGTEAGSAAVRVGGGLACGLSGLAAGMAIGIVGEAVVREGREVWLRLQSPWLPTPFAASCGVGCSQRRELSVGETLTQASAAQPKLFVGMAREYQRISPRVRGVIRSSCRHGAAAAAP